MLTPRLYPQGGSYSGRVMVRCVSLPGMNADMNADMSSDKNTDKSSDKNADLDAHHANADLNGGARGGASVGTNTSGDVAGGIEARTHEEGSTHPPGPVPGQLPVRMRGPADMAEMLPYLLGFFPDDSIVAVGLHGSNLQQGGVIRVDIPDDPECWRPLATETARLLINLSEQRDCRPEQVLLYVCRDPATGDGQAVLAGLAPLAEQLAQAFRAEGVSVKESLCISTGRWWSFLCAGTGCCHPGGSLIRSAQLPGPVAVAATFAGLAPRGSRKAIVAALAPIGPPGAEVQRVAIDRAGPKLLRELAGAGGRPAVLDRTGALIDEVMAEFQAGAREIDPERVARLLVGLQDRLGRDRGAEYAEPDELVPAQRLWRYLAQRCVPPFEHFGAAPLSLLAWTSWLAADTATARIVLARALELDPEYTLAQLLYESLNGGLVPDQLLDSVRRERAVRRTRAAHEAAATRPAPVPPEGGRPVPEQPAPDKPGPGRPSGCQSSVGHAPKQREAGGPADGFSDDAPDARAGGDPETDARGGPTKPSPARRGQLRRRADPEVRGQLSAKQRGEPT